MIYIYIYICTQQLGVQSLRHIQSPLSRSRLSCWCSVGSRGLRFDLRGPVCYSPLPNSTVHLGQGVGV
jgi:hypothetical protein